MRTNHTLNPLRATTLFVFAAAMAAPPALAQPADPAIVYVADYGFSRGQYRKDLMVANADGSNRTAIWSRTSRETSLLLEYPAWSPDVDGDATNGFQGTIAVNGLARLLVWSVGGAVKVARE